MTIKLALDFPGGSGDKEQACQFRRRGFNPWSRDDPLERNGNNSSILTWRLPWTEGLVGQQSMGLQKSQT